MIEFNKWTALVVAVVLAFGYGFALMNMKLFAPALAAQLAGNQTLLQAINRDFQNYDKALGTRFQQDEARIANLEARLGTPATPAQK